jgi:hypothetical protein
MSNPNEERVIRVSAGAVEYVTGKVTDKSGADLTGSTFQVGLGGWDAPPASWRVPDLVEFEGLTTVRVSMLVDSSFPEVERAHMWVKVSDAPEVLPRRCDGNTITVR